MTPVPVSASAAGFKVSYFPSLFCVYLFCFQKMLLARLSGVPRWSDRFSPPRTSSLPCPSFQDLPGPSTSVQAGCHTLPFQLPPSSPSMGAPRARPVVVHRLVEVNTMKGATGAVVPSVSAPQVLLLWFLFLES